MSRRWAEASCLCDLHLGDVRAPKGVVVPHGNVVRLVAQTRGWFDFGPGDAWTLFHSYAFDFSVWEMWGALATGGRLVVVPYLVARSPAEFRELLAAERSHGAEPDPGGVLSADGRVGGRY